MVRRRVHTDDAMLDAARDLLVEGGRDTATTAAISARSGAPTGSLYHRFGSRDGLFAEVWLRTVRRFQTGLLAAAATGSPFERALAAANWTVEFAVRHPDDAHLLLRGSQRSLLADTDLPARTRSALADLNEPVAALLHGLATDLFGSAVSPWLDRVTVAVVDVPYAVARRHLRLGTPEDVCRALIADTARALLPASDAVRSR